jgi:hypothetical protein
MFVAVRKCLGRYEQEPRYFSEIIFDFVRF